MLLGMGENCAVGRGVGREGCTVRDEGGLSVLLRIGESCVVGVGELGRLLRNHYIVYFLLN